MVIGRYLMVLGVGVFALGLLIYLAARLGIPFGRLPGDIKVEGTYLTCIIPLVSSIILSIVLTVLINLLIRYLNR